MGPLSWVIDNENHSFFQLLFTVEPRQQESVETSLTLDGLTSRVDLNSETIYFAAICT